VGRPLSCSDRLASNLSAEDEFASEPGKRTTSCTDKGEGRTLTGMRVRATVVGNTLVLDNDLQLPEGARVEADLQMVNDDEGVEVDAETAAELELAHNEADAGDFVSEEEVWAGLKARRQQ
jgi:predicted phage tail protein